jgi:putative transposase
MQFETGHLYHIYNQGNNRQTLFFNRDNYHYFLKKIHNQIIPYADILAWCLMPNHFHLMVHVNVLEVDKSLFTDGSEDSTCRGATQSRTPTGTPDTISFNASIGIMLASYTRAINKQKGWSGSLFRSKTKSICLTKPKEISPTWITNMGITQINILDSDFQYPNVCFNYILKNPVKGNLVSKPEDWEFSAYNEVVKKIKKILINHEKIVEYGLCFV